MRKWEKPQLKELGIQNTNEWPSFYGIQAGEGYKWVCAKCYKDGRNDIDDREYSVEGDIYTTPQQWCALCGSHKWIKVEANFVPPVS